MRVVIAPDSFGGTASAAEVAAALAAGWRDAAADDEVRTVPMSDGGPGLVDALAGAADPAPALESMVVSGPTGDAVRAVYARIGDTAYIESAAACGLHLLRAAGGDVRTATTYGVGQLLSAAAASPTVSAVVVGLGGSGTNDGGAGLWAALGAEPVDPLRGGGVRLRDLDAVTAPPQPGVQLVAATDVDNPLLGLNGASAVYGPQKGADRAAVMELDAALEHWADLVEAATGHPGLRDSPGAGAAGGLGFGLLALGARVTSGIELMIDRVGLPAKIAGVDLVITGEGRFDATSLRGKVVAGVARVAQQAGVPCVVAAGQAAVGEREAAAYGIDEVFSLAQLRGSPEAAISAGQEGIRELGRAIAKVWSR